MDISFRNSSLKKLCEDPKSAKKKLGNVAAKKLQARLADLIAVEKLGDIPFGNPHPLKGRRTGQFAVNLDGGRRLVFKPSDNPIPQDTSGDIKWREVKSIEIVFIGDYHD
ncbi:MAG: killer suppression protein HigA [Candidatus Dadabacteria bacterium]|nr:killer suppression protein HigA [Candidatus Dadabacteria bacterium]